MVRGMSRRQFFLILASASGCAGLIVALAKDGNAKAGQGFDAFAQALTAGIDSRLKGKVASDGTRNLFAKKDHVAGKYTRNPNLWCADLVPQLTGCAVWKPPGEYAGERYGGVMITSRHILFCRHSHPAWDGGWMKVQPQIIRFVTADNKTVDMKLIANVDSAADRDLSVGLLHEDVPPGIHIAQLMPALSATQKAKLRQMRVPDLGISQAGLRPPKNEKHESVAYVGPMRVPLEGARQPWGYEVYPGDSGTPRFYVTPAGLALYTLSGAGDADPQVIETLIAACDASAIQRGVLKQATGKKLQFAKVTVPAE